MAFTNEDVQEIKVIVQEVLDEQSDAIEDCLEVEQLEEGDVVPLVRTSSDSNGYMKAPVELFGGSGTSDVNGIKVGSNGSVLRPTSGVVTIPSYETNADVTDAENVKAALGVQQGGTRYLKEDGTWGTPSGGGGGSGTVTGVKVGSGSVINPDSNGVVQIPAYPDEQIQSDWNQTNTSAKDYIKNKPTISQGTVNGAKIGSGSTISPDANGIITLPNYETNADVTDAENVKAALGTGSGTTKYLREDGTWQTPPEWGGSAPSTQIIVVYIPTASQSDIATYLLENVPVAQRENNIFRVPGPTNSSFSEWAWDGSAFIMLDIKDYGIDDIPIDGSDNLVKSSGIYKWMRDFGSKANSVYGEYYLDFSHVFDSSHYEYKESVLYDTAWVCLLKGSAKITVTGANVTTIRFFSSFDELNESTSIEANTSGIVPKGAKLAHVILRKENNPSGYDNMTITQYDLLDNVSDNFPKGLFFHPDHLIVNADSQTARYEASSSWDCFHIVINGQYRINIDGLSEGASYRFYNDMNIFDGQPVASKLTGKNTTGIVPENSVICVVNTQKSAYPNGYDDFRLVNRYIDIEYARQNDMAINKGFYIDKNHIVSVNSGVVKYEKINSWDTLVVFTEGAKKIHVNGLMEGATYRFFDSADIFTGEDIAAHLIEANKTGVVPDGAVVEINSLQHSAYPDGYDSLSVDKKYSNDDVKPINMLLIGNSAAQDAIAYVPFILQNMGLTSVKIGLLMQSDSTIQMHVDNFTNESSVYTFFLFNSGSSWTSSSAKSIQWALDNYQWDIVLFHQGANSNTSQYIGNIQPYLNQIANLISTYVDYCVKFVFYQNQARPGESNGGANWSDEVITQHYEKTVLYCQNILKETIFEAIVPVGTAVQNARTIPALKALGDYANVSANTSGLGYLTYDGIHLQEGLPSQLAAYTFVLSILDIYGMKELSINGENTRATSEWTQGKGIPGPHGTPIGSIDENCLMAQKCAIMAIKNPFEVTDMNYIIYPE